MQNEDLKIKINKIKKIFDPKAVAVIGATDKSGSVGRGLCKNLLAGKSKRKIYFVNPYRARVFDYKTYPRITDIREQVDLAVIAVPAKVVLEVTKDCAEKQVGGVIIISAGFAETGKEGKELQDKIVDILRQKNIPLIGPNSLGIIRPPAKLNASFAPDSPNAGEIGFISQSGALIDSVITKSLNENLGFSFVVSYGNGADLGLCDLLKFAAKDKKTKVVALYIEGLKDGRRFFEVARELTKEKPIVVLKGGKTRMAKKAVSSHVGALAGEPQVYSAAFRQAGIIEADSLENLFDISKTLAWQPRCENNIGVVTNAGGAGVLTADYCSELGIKLAKIKTRTLKKIEESGVMNKAYSRNNPLDIIGDALPDRYKVAIEGLLSQRDIYGLIVIQTLQIMTKPMKDAKIVIEARKKYPQKPIITIFIGGRRVMRAIKLLETNKIPNFEEPLRAVKALKALITNP